MKKIILGVFVILSISSLASETFTDRQFPSLKQPKERKLLFDTFKGKANAKWVEGKFVKKDEFNKFIEFVEKDFVKNTEFDRVKDDLEKDIAELQDEVINFTYFNDNIGKKTKEYVDDQLETIESEIEDVIENLSLAAADQEIKTVQNTESIRANRLGIEANKENINKLAENDSIIYNEVKKMGTGVSRIQEELFKTKDKVSKNEGDIHVNKQDIRANRLDIEANKENINKLAENANNKIDENKQAIKTNKNSITENSKNIEINRNAITENSKNIEINRNAITENSKNIEINRDAIAKMDNTNQLKFKELEHGVAMVAAMSSLDTTSSAVGKTKISAAVGGYGSDFAVALGIGRKFNDNLSVNAKLSTSTNSLKKLSYSAGISYEF